MQICFFLVYACTSVFLCMLDIVLKSNLTSDDAAAEVGPWLNDNNRKYTSYLK